MIRPWGVGRALYSTLDPPTLWTRPTVVVNAPNAIAMGLGGKVGFVRASPDCHSHAVAIVVRATVVFLDE